MVDFFKKIQNFKDKGVEHFLHHGHLRDAILELKRRLDEMDRELKKRTMSAPSVISVETEYDHNVEVLKRRLRVMLEMWRDRGREADALENRIKTLEEKYIGKSDHYDIDWVFDAVSWNRNHLLAMEKREKINREADFFQMKVLEALEIRIERLEEKEDKG